MAPADLPLEIQAVAATLAPLRAQWAVAGGWALDLALGRVTRSHADVDIALFRDAQDALREALPAWEFRAASGGVLVPWERGERLELPVHEVHARPRVGARGPALEFLLNEREGADWVYRRDPVVRLPLTRAIQEAPGSGVRVLAPEVVLLYKSKAPRATDEDDFRVARPLLDAQGRAWLRAALLLASPDHPWVTALAPEA